MGTPLIAVVSCLSRGENLSSDFLDKKSWLRPRAKNVTWDVSPARNSHFSFYCVAIDDDRRI